LKNITLFLIFISLQSIHAQQKITAIEVEAYLGCEYSRSFIYYGDISAIGAVEFSDLVLVRGGISFGRTEGHTDTKAFVGARFYPWERIPVNFHASYIYNGLPEYHSHTHTLLPLVSYSTKWAGASTGINFRFTSFFDEKPEIESILSFMLYVNFINNEMLRIGLNWGNYNDFYAKNMGAFSLGLNFTIFLDNNWEIINGFELLQSGADGFASTFYGFAWRGGIKFSW